MPLSTVFSKWPGTTLSKYHSVNSSMINVLILAGSTCFNMCWLVPRFLFRKRTRLYLAGCFLLMLCSFWLQYGVVLSFRQMMEGDHEIENIRPGDIVAYIVVFTLLIIASTGIRLFQQWINDTVRIGHLENARLQIELKHLKSQVNPHFLLNMLNNTDVLIRGEPERASAVIHKLSGLLRYQLYDASHESVLLRDEIAFLKNYLFLEQTRRDHLKVSITQSNTGEDIFIQPLLFISFVENAVKHNIHDAGAYIDVDLSVRKATGDLVFTCINSCASTLSPSDMPGGIGIANIRRRLELLFPSRHQLNMQQTREYFKVELMIRLEGR